MGTCLGHRRCVFTKLCPCWCRIVCPIFTFLTPDITAASSLYTWTAEIPEGLSNYGIQGIPMLWGGDSGRISAFQNTVKPGYASHVAGFNEYVLLRISIPFLTRFIGLMSRASQTCPLLTLTTCGCSSSILSKTTDIPSSLLLAPMMMQENSGTANFSLAVTVIQIAMYVTCVINQPRYLILYSQVDIMAFHGYTTNASAIIDYANYLHDTYNRDVWITEFADQVAVHLTYDLPCQLTCLEGFQRKQPTSGYESNLGLCWADGCIY